jgi:hypothetical protein
MQKYFNKQFGKKYFTPKLASINTPDTSTAAKYTTKIQKLRIKDELKLFHMSKRCHNNTIN